jgi:cytochrome c oxidase assembly protein subunit 11
MADAPDRKLPWKLAALVAASFGFVFALVPLYDALCRVTGFGGKTANVAEQVIEAPDASRSVRVEFLASVASGAPWDFAPAVPSMEVHPGQVYTTHFTARSKSSLPLTAQAVPSVAPSAVAKYFQKTECFCFTQQAFEPHEQRELTLAFMVSPELPKYVDTLSLAYTYFKLPQ